MAAVTAPTRAVRTKSEAAPVVDDRTILDARSLARTVDAIDEAVFFNRPICSAERLRAARWIVERRGLDGAYAGMFAPTPTDVRDGFSLFTGERLPDGAAMRHILGEEATRALRLLDVRDRAVGEALALANAGATQAIRRGIAHFGDRKPPGRFCCTKCSVAVWRHMTAGGLADLDPRTFIANGLKPLKSARLGDGRWQTFPFWYTVLTLLEINTPAAHDELRYAVSVWKRHLPPPASTATRHAERRAAIATRTAEALA
jgi:hypothetical protein